MSGKVVAVREASLSLCLGYVKAPGLSLVYLPLICSTEPSTWKSGPHLTGTVQKQSVPNLSHLQLDGSRVGERKKKLSRSCT